MDASSVYFMSSEFALAAYSTLWAGIEKSLYETALKQEGKGMSSAEAALFAETYTVVDQYTDAVTGVSATIFKNESGALTLAIRGTEASIGDILADAVLALGVPAKPTKGVRDICFLTP